jgi:dsRNA-specific ribonuclease
VPLSILYYQEVTHKALLSDNDCATLAGLGGFMTYHKQLLSDQTFEYVGESFRIYVGALYLQLGYDSAENLIQPILWEYLRPLRERHSKESENKNQASEGTSGSEC